MAADLNTTTSLSLTKTVYAPTTLGFLQNNVVYSKEQFWMLTTIDKNGGTTMTWWRPSVLPAATTALTEGIPPNPDVITGNEITLSFNQYGAYLPYTDRAVNEGRYDVRQIAGELQPEQSRRTIEILDRNIMLAGTNVLYGSTGNRATPAANRAGVLSTMRMNSDILRRARNSLQQNNVPTFSTGRYVAILTPTQVQDLELDDDFVEFNKYQNSAALRNYGINENGYMFSYLGFDIYMSTNPSTVASTVTVQQGVAFGPDWVGKLRHSAMPMQFIHKELGAAGTSDPINQQGSDGWKILRNGTIVGEQARGIRLETA